MLRACDSDVERALSDVDDRGEDASLGHLFVGGHSAERDRSLVEHRVWDVLGGGDGGAEPDAGEHVPDRRGG